MVLADGAERVMDTLRLLQDIAFVGGCLIALVVVVTARRRRRRAVRAPRPASPQQPSHDRVPDWYHFLPAAEKPWAALPVRTIPLDIPRRQQ